MNQHPCEPTRPLPAATEAGASAQLPTPSSESSKATPRTGLAKRRRALVAVVAGALALGGAGLGAAAFVKSPAQVAAETAPPAPDVLSAAVEHRVLSQTLVARGRVAASQSVDVASGGPSGEGIGRAVVTKVKVAAGDSVAAGRPLLDVSGRPVFALRGALPAYRDLGPGLQGEDVAQLQRALASLGHSTGTDRQGTFGPGTGRAVSALYARMGYAAPAADRTAADKPSAPAENDSGAAREPRAAGAAQQPSPAGPATDPAPSVPMAEVVYLESLPARVDAVAAKVGAEPGEKLLTLSAGALAVDGSVAAHEKGLIRPGQQVHILSETTGEEATGEVTSVADAPAPAKDSEGGQSTEKGHPLRIRPAKALPASFAGKEVRLTITAASSGHRVLAVPSSALSAGADGRTTVSVKESDGRQRRIEVRTGMSGDGMVQITPVGTARLTAGEQVVVGIAARGAGER